MGLKRKRPSFSPYPSEEKKGGYYTKALGEKAFPPRRRGERKKGKRDLINTSSYCIPIEGGKRRCNRQPSERTRSTTSKKGKEKKEKENPLVRRGKAGSLATLRGGRPPTPRSPPARKSEALTMIKKKEGGGEKKGNATLPGNCPQIKKKGRDAGSPCETRGKKRAFAGRKV